jgi:hypothetical protein
VPAVLTNLNVGEVAQQIQRSNWVIRDPALAAQIWRPDFLRLDDRQ